jgi:fused signal recognition particle receptor
MDLKRLFFSRLSRTRSEFGRRLGGFLKGAGRIDESLLEELEELLITSDIGVSTCEALMGGLRRRLAREKSIPAETVLGILKDETLGLLGNGGVELSLPASQPAVYLFVGVNGVGKTTTIGKLAHRFEREGKRTCLAACDTFRAGAIDQLRIWADRAGSDFIGQEPGSDPGAVAFDAVAAAKSRNLDILLIDTAGRLHTRVNLMEELKKIKRVIGRNLNGAPHETLLVLDATTGQNGLNQARAFHETLDLTGLALAKLDGTAKGGVVLAIYKDIGLPVKLVGLGEGMDDLLEFNPEYFVEALFSSDST